MAVALICSPVSPSGGTAMTMEPMGSRVDGHQQPRIRRSDQGLLAPEFQARRRTISTSMHRQGAVISLVESHPYCH